MDSNASSFVMNSSALNSVYYQAREDDGGFIDLGLSLRTLQSQAYNHQPGFYQRVAAAGDDCEEEGDGVESKERLAFVKVTMDGVVVGRKISIIDHTGYSSLAHQLENMFGGQCPLGLRLFESGSEFGLLYKDREDNWRRVGDVPWKEFVESVKRIRIARK